MKKLKSIDQKENRNNTSCISNNNSSINNFINSYNKCCFWRLWISKTI